MQKLRFKTKSIKYMEPLAICKISKDETGNKIYTPKDFLIVHGLTEEEEKTLHNNDSRKDIAYITSEGNVYVASDIKYKTKLETKLSEKETRDIFTENKDALQSEFSSYGNYSMQTKNLGSLENYFNPSLVTLLEE